MSTIILYWDVYLYIKKDRKTYCKCGPTSGSLLYNIKCNTHHSDHLPYEACHMA